MFKAFRSFNTNVKVFTGVAGALVGVQALSVYNPIYLENLKSVLVDNSIDPFPTKLSNYSMLGHGVRSVTFIGFKVYGAAIYVKDSDKSKVKSIVSERGFEKLEDVEESTELISKICDSVDFKVRICPVRNTDFNHLRDGFVKSILSNPLSKNNAAVGAGLDELRTLFKGFKGSVPKNHILLLQTDKGKLTFTYENTKTGEIKVLGTVNEPLVSKLLLISYLSSRKPLSEPLRKSCVEGIKNL
ncbi:Altered inheritance of mitochondria protein 18 mitochondrial [Yamadazyma tenuis]|uniref:Altered inheritance of mitochondria protein 18, mitochondrial n=1 Tax=Candida tenuis (strain ATCC 10573 / BCRC 21748 / CBS 615 / JCM 9827 / NBRC 10315 / NRRL Y-1498 / VKM Y-70) TaxID=590646 RepID=G3BDV0_CANTC|nr:chalcone isomerase [Yamadazyma tenuis ATCC 10573]EGV60387.1 chalcone isomerase [Yamadazyma tenuis ATCC 10573]WEJ94368.1 Altered inheritance of mitochondria protein 18 mitochondrial [Yamadazyma tenuis]